MLLQLPDDAPLLQLVHLDDGVQQLEVVTGVTGEQLQERDVLRETRAAEPDAGAQIARPDTGVEAHPPRDVVHVGADELAHVRDLVDEADARAEERVRCELDHLGRRDVGPDYRSVEPDVELLDRLRVGLLERADDDPVRLEKVAHGRSLREELRVRRIADRVEAARVKGGANLLARPYRNRAL